MKNIMIIAAAVAGLSSVAAAAQAQDGILRIDGTIAPVCTIAAGNDVQNINLTSASTPLGNLDVTCNDPQGFSVSVRSQNNAMVDFSGGGSPTSYDYSITAPSFGISVNPTTTATSVNAAGLAADAVDGVLIPITLTNVVASGPAYAGWYLDYVEFTVTAN
jgi:opacity protein-like surface antigen